MNLEVVDLCQMWYNVDMKAQRKTSSYGTRVGVTDEALHKFRMNDAFPSFEAARDIEWIRSEGKHDMITEYHAVVQRLIDAGAWDGVLWFEQCRDVGISFMRAWDLERLELHYGPSDRWVTPDVRRKYGKACIKSAMRRLQEQMDDLDDAHEAIEAAGPHRETLNTTRELRATP